MTANVIQSAGGWVIVVAGFLIVVAVLLGFAFAIGVSIVLPVFEFVRDLVMEAVSVPGSTGIRVLDAGIGLVLIFAGEMSKISLITALGLLVMLAMLLLQVRAVIAGR